MGVLPGHLRRPADLDGAQQPLDLGVALLAVDDAVDAQRLGELAADGAHRVEGGLGVLEHHRHPVAAQRPHLLGVAQVDVDAADAEAPVVELAVRREQTHHGEAEGRLPGAGLADDGHAVPGGHGEVDAVEGVHPSTSRRDR